MMHLLTCSSSKTKWVVSSVSLGNRKACTNIVTFLPQLSPPGSRVSPGTNVLIVPRHNLHNTVSQYESVPTTYPPTRLCACWCLLANVGAGIMNNTQWDSKQQTIR